MADTNDRLTAALTRADAIADRIRAERTRTHFTPESAASANARKAELYPQKPETATARLWAEAIAIASEAWPKNIRVEAMSKAIIEAAKKVINTENTHSDMRFDQ